MTKLESAIDLLKEAHDELDCLVEWDSLDGALCYYCKSREHNGREGIVHYSTCILKRIRLFLAAVERDKNCLEEK